MIKYVRDGVDVVVLYQLLQYWSAYVQVPAKDSNIYQLVLIMSVVDILDT